jgi:hypothetical protein
MFLARSCHLRADTLECTVQRFGAWESSAFGNEWGPHAGTKLQKHRLHTLWHRSRWGSVHGAVSSPPGCASCYSSTHARFEHSGRSVSAGAVETCSCGSTNRAGMINFEVPCCASGLYRLVTSEVPLVLMCSRYCLVLFA